MAWKPAGRESFRVWVTDGTRRKIRSTGRVLPEEAEAVEQAVRRWQGDAGEKYAKPAVIEAILDGVLQVGAAYDAELDGTLPAVLTAARAGGEGPSLHPLVTEWHTWRLKQRKGAKSADANLREVRKLYPADRPFHLGDFTRPQLAARLDRLTVTPSTKNRYRASCSSFAKFLVRRDVLATNPVRDVESFGEAPPRVVYYERPQAKALIAALTGDSLTAAALGCAFAAEWAAIEHGTVADLDLTPGRERFTTRGTKTDDRHRVVPLVRDNRWLLPHLERAVAGKAPTDPLVRYRDNAVRFGQQRVARRLGIVAVGEDRFSQHTLHDWRSTHCVQLLRDGYHPQIAARHLGHRNTVMVTKRYGVFIPTESDYDRPRPSRSVPRQTTTPPKTITTREVTP